MTERIYSMADEEDTNSDTLVKVAPKDLKTIIRFGPPTTKEPELLPKPLFNENGDRVYKTINAYKVTLPEGATFDSREITPQEIILNGGVKKKIIGERVYEFAPNKRLRLLYVEGADGRFGRPISAKESLSKKPETEIAMLESLIVSNMINSFADQDPIPDQDTYFIDYPPKR